MQPHNGQLSNSQGVADTSKRPGTTRKSRFIRHVLFFFIIHVTLIFLSFKLNLGKFVKLEAAQESASQAIVVDKSTVVDKSEVDWEEIDRLLRSWDQVHHYVDQQWDETPLPNVLTGSALAEQREVMRILREKNCRWRFTDLAAPVVLDRQVISTTEVMVTMRKHWDGDLYCNGVFDPGSFDEPFVVRYRLLYISEGWRVAGKEVIER